MSATAHQSPISVPPAGSRPPRPAVAGLGARSAHDPSPEAAGRKRPFPLLRATHRDPIQQYANSLNSRPLTTRSPCPSCHDPNQLGNAALLEMMGGFEGGTRLAGDEDFSILGFDGGFGVQDGPAGGTRVGTQAGGHVLKSDLPIQGFSPLKGCNLETTSLSAGVDSTVGTDGVTQSVGAEWGGAAVACDKPVATEVDRDLTRFGVSLGTGFGARAHWSDEDHDCRPEYGVGLNLGPFSFDQKSEAPFAEILGTPEGCVP